MDREVFLKKLDNFWYYYKFHVIGGIVALILIISFVSDIIHQQKPDVAIANIGAKVLNEEAIGKFSQQMSGVIQDADGNRKKYIQVTPIIYFEKMDPEQKQAISQKIQLTLISGEAQLFLVDKPTFKDLANLGAFQPIDELASKYGINVNTNPDIKLKARETNEEHIYGLPLTDNALFKEMGYDTSGIYAAIKIVNNDEQKDKTKQAAFKNAYLLLEEIMKHNKKAG